MAETVDGQLRLAPCVDKFAEGHIVHMYEGWVPGIRHVVVDW